MRLTFAVRQVALAALVVGAGQAAYATNGYFSHGYGIKAKGMGGAAVAMAQHAFAGANNPAASAFAGNRYDVGADLFMPERGMSRTFAGATVAETDSSREHFLIPEFGYNVALSNKIGVGLTVYGNGGMNTDYPTNVLNGQGHLGQNLMQLIVAPTVAYKVADNHSFGVSPLLVHQRFKAYGLQGFSGMSASPSNLTNNDTDSSNGVGLRLGYMGKLTDKITVGASYSPKINMTRFKSYKGLFASQGDFDIPENVTLGMAFQVTPAVLLALDYQRINYSGVPAVANPSSNMAPLGSANGPGFGWRDIDVWKLGVQWQVNPTWTLRAGYNKGQNPVMPNDVTFNILAPGVVTDHITLGATMQIDKASELSFSYAHAQQKSVNGVSMFDAYPMPNGSGGAGLIRETIGMKQNAFGIQYSRKF